MSKVSYLKGYKEYKQHKDIFRKITAKGLIVIFGLSIVLMFWK